MLFRKLKTCWKVGAMEAPKVQGLIKKTRDGSMFIPFKTGFLARSYPTWKNWMGIKSS